MEIKEVSIRPESSTLLGGALIAIASKDIGAISKKLSALNERLTGGMNSDFKDEESLQRALEPWMEELREMGDADVMIYLGDSGFSRLNIGIKSQGEPFISLTSNSSKQVKEKWDTLQREYELAKQQSA